MTQPSPPPEAQCLICTMWGRLPYARRPTTPTTPQETEGAMVIGYWIHSRKAADTVPRICPRHMAYLGMLDQQEERRQAAEAAFLASQAPPTPHFAGVIADLQARMPQPAPPPAPPPPPPPVIPILAGVPPVMTAQPMPGGPASQQGTPQMPPAPQVGGLGIHPLQNPNSNKGGGILPPGVPPPPYVTDTVIPQNLGGPYPSMGSPPASPQGNANTLPFAVGPGPLPSPSVPPPLAPTHPPIVAPPVEVQGPTNPGSPLAAGATVVVPQVNTDPLVGTMEGARLAAQAPPTQGAKGMATCAICKTQYELGTVHGC